MNFRVLKIPCPCRGRSVSLPAIALFTGGLFGAFFLLTVLFWQLLPCLVTDPLLALSSQTPVRRYLDRDGNLLYLERTYDYQWRLPVSLDKISPAVINATLAAEDANFWHHHGVDYSAVVRATWQNVHNGRIISGASTLSMQLAGLAEPGRKRSWKRKLQQVGQARLLEKKYSKERILAEYLNRAPYGGKIYGIEAAAKYYFGKNAADLTIAEAALLCGLPQRPNGLRPDRHPQRARRRQRLVLIMMERRGYLDYGQAKKIFWQDRLAWRNFAEPPPFQPLPLDYRQHYFACARREADFAEAITCNFAADKDALLWHTLHDRVQQLPGVNDAAAVLLDHGGAVLSMIGTIDFASPNAGQVNAALAWRSAGSALKPFIYAEAIDGGLLVEDSLLFDAPIRYGEYAPGNSDGTFNGLVTVGEALSRSLNTPVVQVLAELGPNRMVERLQQMQAWPVHRKKIPQLQLTIALGTAGHTLLDLTAAYATLASYGDYRPAKFTTSSVPAPRAVFSAGTCSMISDILQRQPLVPGGIRISWKTGTSNGNRDAWCFAYTPEYTLGVWFGNKDNSSASALTGIDAAAPAAAAILNALYHQRPLPTWQPSLQWQQQVTLCEQSGLLAAAACSKARQGTALRDIPLRQCRANHQALAPPVAIISPEAGHYASVDGSGKVTLSLQAQPPDAHWYVDNAYCGIMPPKEKMTFSEGRHVIHIVNQQKSPKTAKVTFSVGKKMQ